MIITVNSLHKLFNDLHNQRKYVDAVNLLINFDLVSKSDNELVVWLLGSERFYGRLGVWDRLADRCYSELLDRGNTELAHRVLDIKSR